MNYSYNPTPLATGGEKVVHRGICIETRVDVVIKFLRQPYTVADVRRFSVEIERMQRAKQGAGDRVATLIDFNLEHDPPFYVEEYFPDGTLAKLMADVFKQGKVFRPDAALGYCRQLLLALHGIHSTNQIHRDVKPANIAMKGSQLVLLDMGIGRTLARPTVLQTRAFCGTRGYAAPEQELGGRAGGVDHRADLYAVGVILHEMLTGERGAWNQITYARGGVEPVLRQLLAFRREHRPASAAAAVGLVQRLLAPARSA